MKKRELKMNKATKEAMQNFIFDDKSRECVMEGLAIIGWRYKTDKEGMVRPFPIPLED